MDIIEFRPFEIGQKDYINRFFKACCGERADCSFETLFLWSETYQTRWAEEDGVFYVRAGTGADIFFMPPFTEDGELRPASLDRIRAELAAAGRPFAIRAASPATVERIETLWPGTYRFVEERDNWEYIYRTSDLIQLPGKKFRMKKNHLNGFLRQYGDYQYEPIGADNMEETKAALEAWFVRHGRIEAEERAIALALAHWDALGMKGAVIRIYGRIEAVTMGSLLSSGVAHIFFEKANPDIRGLYQVINRDFLLREFGDTEFVNREEDMGLAGLRQAKLEYHPDHFAEKYSVLPAE